MAKLKYIKTNSFVKPTSKPQYKDHQKVCLCQATERLAKDIQHYLFAKRFSWGGHRIFKYTDKPYIYVDFRLGRLSFASNNHGEWACPEINFTELKQILD